MKMIYAYSAISDLSLEAQELLKNAGIELTINSDKRPDETELIELVQQYDMIIIGAKEKMTRNVFNSATRLSIIATLSIGTDHISQEFKESTRHTIINTPNANVISVAEHTFALILALKKRILEGNKAVLLNTGRDGLLRKPEDLTGRVLGVIGAGRIAHEVIKISKVFSMKILCYTYHPECHPDMLNDNVEFVNLEDLLSNSDIITLHLPLTEQSLNLINEQRLNLIRNDAILINTSRAEIVDIASAISKASKEPSFYLGMDIDAEEYHYLFNAEQRNVIITPHIAGVSIDAIMRMDLELAQNVISYIQRV